MIRYIFLLILSLPTFSYAQLDTLRIFRTHNEMDTSTIFMENADCPLPKKGITTYAITITVTDIRNNDGVIRFKFYDEHTPFPDDKGFLRIIVPKSEVRDNTFTATYYGFPSRTMGIALLDDENDNWKLDVAWFLPKEGHAFSDYYHTSLRRPIYSDFSFLLVGNKHVTMKMKYY